MMSIRTAAAPLAVDMDPTCGAMLPIENVPINTQKNTCNTIENRYLKYHYSLGFSIRFLK